MGVVEPIGEPKPRYSAPERLNDGHRLDGFDCGKPALDDWLKAHAMDNEGKASRTYVVLAQGGPCAGTVAGFYTLATGGVARDEVPRKIRQGLPNPVPIMVLGRLAVDHRHSGNMIGSAMLREAMQRTAQVAAAAGVRALLVHAIDDDAVGFYAKYGFQIFPAGTRTMFLPIETIAAAIAE